MDAYALLKFLANLILPPAALGVGVVLTLLLLIARRRRLAVTVLVLSLAYTLVLAYQPVGDVLMHQLEDKAREAELQAPPCCYDAIVVLGGGIAAAHPPQRPLPELTDNADRIWQAARLWRRGAAPCIIVSGGSFSPGHEAATTEAAAMRVFLLDLGVPSEAIIDEGKSINTIENIRNVKAIIGDGRVALVTSAFHMPRALQLARRAGLDAAAFPTDYQALALPRMPWDNWLPSVEGLRLSTAALKEIVALNFDFRRSALDR
ncbi:MAG: YdcF family protein [Reyranella sp.]|uniref:YdcF family protein n=1 Tax=Reyranella sp. TaxID=1929291 RepID=UPI001AD3EB2D|nr:YdcF family protein [Reyranella sp.]MBN9085744.1 YdcF family protein [Reyranella sp.]